MKKSWLFVLLLTATFSACIKKQLDLELVEPSCKGFKIKGIYYQFITDPTCDSTATTGTLAIKGDVDGDADCIDYMVIETHFFDISGTELTPLSGGYQKQGSSDITITDGKFSVNMNYSFSTADYKKINYIHLNYHTENELGNASNELSLRANPSCATIPTPTSFNQTITVGDTVNYINVNFADHKAQDGDLISLNVNGNWVLENILLTKVGENYSVPVTIGQNWFYLYALNQGTSGPNTVEVTISTNVDTSAFELNMKTGESTTFKVIVQ